MYLGKVRDQFFFHDTKNKSAQDCAPDCPDAANHWHEQNGNAGGKGKHALRMNVSRITRIDAPGDSGQGCRQRMHP